jgi:hypothetical protein
MSAAISGLIGNGSVCPGCRCAHPGYKNDRVGLSGI